MLDTQAFGRVLASRGNIHITGDGLSDSSARVNDVARVMTGFQRLTTAVGASQTGDKALGKQPNADVQRRTDLLLSTATPPGFDHPHLHPGRHADRRGRPPWDGRGTRIR